MPLTPEDVQNKEFTTVRLREGYDMQEVDNFLDEVESELTRLHRENDELRDKLAAATRDGGVAASAEPVTAPSVVVPEPEPEPAREPDPPREPEPAPEPVPVAAAAAPAAAAPPPPEAAAQVLARAQRTADELGADARAEAEQLVAESRTRSEQLDADTQMRAAELEKQNRERSEALEREHHERRSTMLNDLQAEQSKLEREVEKLRAFEREYRSRLKAYLEGQLHNLESGLTARQDSESLGSDVPRP